ncbi:hypothetical protein M5E86_03580 [Blautia wexlerae]|nr:hypothetical protein M5E86_03580 [Blautia wexlerae]
MIRKLFAFGLAVVLALMPVQAFGKTVSVTNVSYDPTREMFEQYNKIFEDHWKGEDRGRCGSDTVPWRFRETGTGGSQWSGCRCGNPGT